MNKTEAARLAKTIRLMYEIVQDALDTAEALPNDDRRTSLRHDLVELREQLWQLYQAFDLQHIPPAHD